MSSTDMTPVETASGPTGEVAKRTESRTERGRSGTAGGQRPVRVERCPASAVGAARRRSRSGARDRGHCGRDQPIALARRTGVRIRPQTSGVDAPNGMKSVGYYGITVTVPRTFAVGPVGCVPPTRDSVVPDTGEVYRCPTMRGDSPQPQGLTIVYLQPTSTSTGHVHAVRSTTVDGIPALTGDGYDLRGRPTSILVIARNNVAVEVTAPTFEAAHRMLQRVHIAPVDPRGCSDRRLPVIGEPQTSAILPGKPISAVACEYSTTHRLLGSGRLSPVLLRHAVDVLQRAYSSMVGIPFHTLLVTYIFQYADGTKRTITSDLDTYPFIATDGQHAVRLSTE